MRKRRLFVAIPISEHLLSQVKHIYGRNDIPGRITPIENLHVTVHFLGSIIDSEVEATIDLVRKASLNHQSFEMEFAGFQFKKGFNKMVWGVFNHSLQFKSLALDVKNTLGANDRKVKPHITFSRLKEIPQAELPLIEEVIPFEVNRIELWESKLGGKTAVYSNVQTFPLK